MADQGNAAGAMCQQHHIHHRMGDGGCVAPTLAGTAYDAYNPSATAAPPTPCQLALSVLHKGKDCQLQEQHARRAVVNWSTPGCAPNCCAWACHGDTDTTIMPREDGRRGTQ